MGYKILFVICPLLGHVNTTTKVLKELVKEGHEVVYCTTTQYKQTIENTGATVMLLDHPAFDMSKEKLTKCAKYLENDQTKMLTWLLLWMISCDFASIQVVKKLKSQQFDMVLYDDVFLQYNFQVAQKVQSKCKGTYQISQVMGTQDGLPGVKFQLNFSLLELVLIMAYMYIVQLYLRAVHQFQFRHALAPFQIRENFNLVCIPKEFQQPSKAFNFVNDGRFCFDGPFIRDNDDQELVRDFPFHQLTRARTMYISLGSVSNCQEKIYNTFMEAYSHPYFEDWNIVLNCDDVNKLKKWGQVPDNFIIKDFVPQLAILKRSNLFVCHGGINSVQEAVMCNVPQLVLPQIPERQMNANSVKRLQLGDYVSQDCSAQELREKSIRLIEDKQYSQGIEKFKHILQQQSAKKAAMHIVQYIKQNSN